MDSMVGDFSTEDVDNVVDRPSGKCKNEAFSADSRWLGQGLTNSTKTLKKHILAISPVWSSATL
jgi:hypothetical protein